jgi:hypothetical protein
VEPFFSKADFVDEVIARFQSGLTPLHLPAHPPEDHGGKGRQRQQIHENPRGERTDHDLPQGR